MTIRPKGCFDTQIRFCLSERSMTEALTRLDHSTALCRLLVSRQCSVRSKDVILVPWWICGKLCICRLERSCQAPSEFAHRVLLDRPCTPKSESLLLLAKSTFKHLAASVEVAEKRHLHCGGPAKTVSCCYPSVKCYKIVVWLG
jgi:hypothetical protein